MCIFVYVFILMLRLKAITSLMLNKLLLYPQPALCGIFKELCPIRDNTSSCDIAATMAL